MSLEPDTSTNNNCQWIGSTTAFRTFATHEGSTQSARHIKPLHWYIACRLVLEGGFHPAFVRPRPPFEVVPQKAKGGPKQLLIFDPSKGGKGEQIILGGLKTKNVDVVVTLPDLGPVLAVSCKGVTKAFRNLTNRMEETIGECTNLHITYPAMVLGYFAVLRANRTIQDAIEAPDLAHSDSDTSDSDDSRSRQSNLLSPKQTAKIEANDIAIRDGAVVDSIVRFHSALCEMTGRRGIRDEISRYEAMTISLVEPKGIIAGRIFSEFPEVQSPLRLENFFEALYLRYEERFVFGAPLLAERGTTVRLRWDPESPALQKGSGAPELDFAPRLADR